MEKYVFIYSTHPKKIDQKTIISHAENEGTAYSQFINGLVRPATLVINKSTGRRII